MSFNERLENKSVIILDGGTGSEVYRLIKDINNPAWSSLANLNHSNIVQKSRKNPKFLKNPPIQVPKISL